MVKEKRILSYFIGWLILGLSICFIGVNKIFASTTKFWGATLNQPKQAYFYDCTSSGCNTDYTSNNGIGYDGSGNEYGIYWANDLYTVANSYGAMSVIRPDTSLLKDKIYSTTIYMCSESSYIVPINLYSGSLTEVKNRNYSVEQLTGWGNADLGSEYPYSRIELGGAISNPIINNCRAVSFIYTPKVNSTFIGFQFTTGSTVTGNEYLIGYKHEYLGDNNSLDENQVNSIINNQTTIIQNDINNMQQSIVNSNKETQEVIKDQFNSCRPSVNIANITSSTDYNFIIGSVENGKTYTLSFISNSSVSFHIKNSNDEIITSRYGFNGKFEHTFQSNGTIQILFNGFGDIAPNITKIQLQEGSVATAFEEPGAEICSNKIDETNDKLDDVNNTSKGIWETIKNLPNMFLDMLLGLFIPKDLSFINEFKDVISNKLGFIASVPIQIIDFALVLADVSFNEITTISFPSVEIFGVHFWNAEEIDITILLEKLKPFKYFTDFTCVILCCRTLYYMYHNFTGGAAD